MRRDRMAPGARDANGMFGKRLGRACMHDEIRSGAQCASAVGRGSDTRGGTSNWAAVPE